MNHATSLIETRGGASAYGSCSDCGAAVVVLWEVVEGPGHDRVTRQVGTFCRHHDDVGRVRVRETWLARQRKQGES